MIAFGFWRMAMYRCYKISLKLLTAIPLVYLLTFTSVTTVCYAANDADNPVFDGEVLVEEIKHPTGIPGLRATFVVHAKREAIWAALTDYVNFTKIFDGIDKMKVTEQDDKGVTIEFWVDSIIDLHYVLRRTYDSPGKELSWKRISGDLDDIVGRWLIQDTDKENVFIVKYESYVDVGNFIFTFFTRLVAMNKAHSMAIKLRKWIESHQ
jgi:hypothetical protein